MYRLSYRGHDVVIFVDANSTEVTIESLEIYDEALDCANLAAGLKYAQAVIDRAVGDAPVRYLARIA